MFVPTRTHSDFVRSSARRWRRRRRRRRRWQRLVDITYTEIQHCWEEKSLWRARYIRLHIYMYTKRKRVCVRVCLSVDVWGLDMYRRSHHAAQLSTGWPLENSAHCLGEDLVQALLHLGRALEVLVRPDLLLHLLALAQRNDVVALGSEIAFCTCGEKKPMSDFIFVLFYFWETVY